MSLLLRWQDKGCRATPRSAAGLVKPCLFALSFHPSRGISLLPSVVNSPSRASASDRHRPVRTPDRVHLLLITCQCQKTPCVCVSDSPLSHTPLSIYHTFLSISVALALMPSHTGTNFHPSTPLHDKTLEYIHACIHSPSPPSPPLHPPSSLQSAFPHPPPRSPLTASRLPDEVPFYLCTYSLSY